MSDLLRPLDWVVHNLAFYIGGLLLLALIVVTNIDVGLRKSFEIFGNPLFNGANDYSKLALLLIVGISLGYGARTGGNVSVEILNTVLPTSVTRWMHAVIRLFSAGLWGFGSYLMFLSGIASVKYKEGSPDLNIPYEKFYYAFAAFIAIYALILLGEAISLALKGKVDLLIDESSEVSAYMDEDAREAGTS